MSNTFDKFYVGYTCSVSCCGLNACHMMCSTVHGSLSWACGGHTEQNGVMQTLQQLHLQNMWPKRKVPDSLWNIQHHLFSHAKLFYNSWSDSQTSLRPSSVRNCSSEMCDVHWKVLPWRKCTVVCGSGFQSRRVECVHRQNRNTLPDQHCAWQRRPFTWQHCNITSCGSRSLSFSSET